MIFYQNSRFNFNLTVKISILYKNISSLNLGFIHNYMYICHSLFRLEDIKKMSNSGKCPNTLRCQILTIPGFVESEDIKDLYFKRYCSVDTEDGYLLCKRFQTKKSLGFCPDFVLPDSNMTLDEIMDKCEE